MPLTRVREKKFKSKTITGLFLFLVWDSAVYNLGRIRWNHNIITVVARSINSRNREESLRCVKNSVEGSIDYFFIAAFWIRLYCPSNGLKTATFVIAVR